MRRFVLVSVVVVALLLGLGVLLVLRAFEGHLPPSIPIGRACEVRTGSGAVGLSSEQMANAATIAAVAMTRHLPDQAVVVALATAMQESELVNLTGGDRDSIGLFQQRPSQGWGTVENISDPRYAANAFYNQLVKVPGWQDMRVTDAAQRVQRSAFPEAYEKWADDATVLSEALVGAAAATLTCTRFGEPALRGEAATAALFGALVADWGEGVPVRVENADDRLVIGATDERAGWRYAHWLVAHSKANGVARVTYADRTWDADSGAWLAAVGTGGEPGHVVAQLYPG